MTDIRVPALGESVTEATVGKWFKQPGDSVAVDEPLVELETDKVTLEVPAPAAGVLSDVAAKEGSTVAPGALLGQIKDGAGKAGSAAAAKPAASPTGAPDKKISTSKPIGAGPEEPTPREVARRLHCPVDQVREALVRLHAQGKLVQRSVKQGSFRYHLAPQ